MAHNADSTTESVLTRRHAIAAVGGVLSTGIAGCGGSGEPTEAQEETPTEMMDTPTETPTPEPTPTETPTESPTPTPSPFPDAFGVAATSPAVDGTLDDTPESGGVSLEESGRAVNLSGNTGATMDDLSVGGTFWLSHDDENLYLQANIEDDTHHQENTGGTTWQGDGIQFGIQEGAPGESTTFGEYNIALTPEGPQVFKNIQPAKIQEGLLDSVDAEITRDDDAGETHYEIAFPWDEIEANPDDGEFAASFLLNENDGDGRNAAIEVGSGILNPKDSTQFILAELN
jgi:hypothetical protein